MLLLSILISLVSGFIGFDGLTYTCPYFGSVTFSNTFKIDCIKLSKSYHTKEEAIALVQSEPECLTEGGPLTIDDIGDLK